LGLHISAQTWTFPVSGRVTKNGKKLEGAVITLIKDGAEDKQIVTSGNGKFDFVLQPNSDYVITVTKPNFITKRFSFNTQNVPDDRGAKGFGGVDLQEIVLFEIPKNVDLIELNAILSQPIAKFAYQTTARDFNYDEGYTQSMRSKLEKLAVIQKKAEDDDKKKTEEDKKKALADGIASDKYNAAISGADKALLIKDYVNAKAGYNEALGIKPAEKYPKDKISEIDKILADIAAKEAADKAAKEAADKAAKEAADKAAKEAADKAAKDAADKAAKEAADKAAKEAADKAAKEAADKAAKEAADKAAKEAADKAAKEAADKAAKEAADKAAKEAADKAAKDAADKAAKEAADKAAKEAADKAAKDAADKATKEKELNDKYNAALERGNKNFAAKDYLGAKAAFSEALNFKNNEEYPKKKLVEIDKLLADLASKEASENEKEAREKVLNEKYLQALNKGNKAFESKDYEMAKSGYNEALAYKPNEQLPKDKLAEIKKLEEQKEKSEAEKVAKAAADKSAKDAADKAAKEAAERTSREAAEKTAKDAEEKAIKTAADKVNAEKEQEDQYKAALTKADNAFNGKQLRSAQGLYSEALSIKPDEKYPKDKIKEIEGLLDEQAAKDAEKAKHDKYKVLIDKADKQFLVKQYGSAKMIYKDALVLLPDEKYPRDKIIQIDDLVAKEKTLTASAVTAKPNPTPAVVRSAAIVAPPKDADPEMKKQYVNTLVSKYPQGITEEKSQEGNCKIVKLIVVRGNNAAIYRKSIWAWGQIFYFKDDISITEAAFSSETQ